MNPQELDSAISSANAAISALDECSKHWDKTLLVITGAVILGVLLEIVETAVEHVRETRDWKFKISWLPEKPKHWLFGFQYLAIVLVVGGVGGELGVNILQMRINNKLRIENAALVSLVDKKAGIANISASESLQSATWANQAALVAGQRAEKATADANLANSLALKASKQAVDSRRELAQFREPRTFTAKQRQDIIDGLKPYSGTEFDLSMDPTPETLGVMERLYDILTSAGWVPRSVQAPTFVDLQYAGITIGTAFETMIMIRIPPTFTPKQGEAAEKLHSFLEGTIPPAARAIFPDPNDKTNHIHIVVGIKP